MDQKNLNLLSAKEAINLIQSGKISVKELIESCISQIEKNDKRINAWTVYDKDNAIRLAENIDKKFKEGKSIGMLCGIPVAVKDIFNTTEFCTQHGSIIRKDYTPGNDARVVFRIKQEDGIVLGKTVTAEFGVHHPGPTVNPHNFRFSPGTSSSGSAAAVASFMVPLALGSQTAGSTLRPASYCGIYGFKPSFGLIPRTGMLKTTDTLDNVGLMARTIDDIELIFDVLRISGTDHPFSDISATKDLSKKWKIIFIRSPKWNFAEEYAKIAILDFVKKLTKDKQINIGERELADEFEKVHEMHEKIYCRELAYYFKEEYGNHKDKLSETFIDMIERGNKIDLNEYMLLLDKQSDIREKLNKLFEDTGADVILTLTTGGEAMDDLYKVDRPDSCLIWTFCGVPAISLPVFKGPNNLPFGLQIVGKRKKDKDLINFARYLKNNNYIPDVTYPENLNQFKGV